MSIAQSLIIIGETGAAQPINSLNELKSECEKYFSNLGVTHNDISILNNIEQNFIRYNKIEYKPDSKYYLFTKRYDFKLIKLFKEFQGKNTASFATTISDNSLNVPDISKYLTILQDNQQFLSCSIEDIKNSFDAILSFYNKFNNINKNFKIHNKLAEKIKENYKYQNDAVDLLHNVVLLKYEQCNNKYKEFLKQSEELKIKNRNILKNYADNINKLKSVEIPKPLIEFLLKKTKKQNLKYLIDIYYNENDMNVWRDNCLNKEECLFSKVKLKEKILLKEKSQINKQDNSVLAPMKNNWNFNISEYDNLFKDRNEKVISLLNEINTDFTNFNNILEQIKEIFESKLINSNPNYVNTIKENCLKIMELKEKYLDDNKLKTLTNYLQPLIDYTNKMKNSIENISKKINDYFMEIRSIKNILEKLTEKIDGYIKALTNIEEDFKFLETPGHFINSYEKTLIEIKRRINFNSDMPFELQKIQGLITNENYLRRKFIDNNKKYLTPDFIKLFKLENKFTFNFDFSNNNEYNDLSNFDIPDDDKNDNDNNNNNSVNKNNSTISNNHNNSKETSLITNTNNANQEKNIVNFQNTGQFNMNENDNKKVIQNLLNQINELEANLKNKNKEISDCQNKYNQIENNFQELNKDIRNIYTNFDEISDAFNAELNSKEKIITDLKNLTLNLQKMNTQNNINNHYNENCPLCKERKLNSKEYLNIDKAFKDKETDIMKYKKQIGNLDSSFKKLVNNSISIKKCFFNHMNMEITKKNIEMAIFKEKYEQKMMFVEEILSAEKIFNKNAINDEFSKLNNLIKDCQLTITNYQEKNKNMEKTINGLKTKELFYKRELQILQQSNEKLSDTNIELNNELRQKHKDNTNLTKLLEQSKKEHVDSIKILNSTQQANIDCLKVKLNELSEKIKEKEKEDSKKFQEYSKIKENYAELLKEKEYHIKQINDLSNDLSEKNKKIEELMQTLDNNTHLAKTSNVTSIDFNLSHFDDDVLYYKKLEKGLRCIFVPFSSGIFVCINLNENLIEKGGDNKSNMSNYECKYILDLNSFDKNLSKIIMDNSLIVIGKVAKLTEINETQSRIYNLPEDKQFVLVTLGKIDYVIGFPENDFVFNNYIR